MSELSHSFRGFKARVDRLVFFLFRILFRTPKGNSSKTLLLIRTDGIGDLVFSLPYIQALKNHFHDHRLVLVCRDTAAPLAKPDLFDVVIPFRYMQYRWNYLYRFRILRRIHTHLPSYTLYLSYHRQHIGDEMAILSGAERVVAFDGNDEIIHPRMRLANDQYYSTVVPAEDHSRESEKYHSLLMALGVSARVEYEKRGELLGNNEVPEKRFADEFILLAPGGSSPLRRWPADRFAEVGNRLAESSGLKVVLCGNREENDLLREIAAKMSKPHLIESDLPLGATVALIRKAKLVVGNESGLLHIAASVGTPSLVILGGGHFSRYFPYGSAKIVHHKLDCYECNWKCPFPEPYCLTRISVEEVVGEVRQVKSKG